jgi:hypothetical protein
MDGYIYVDYDAAMHPHQADPQTRHLPGALDGAASLTSDKLARLREEFTGFRIWQETSGDRVRYVAQRAHPGVRPHTVVSADPDELRAVLAGQDL